MSDFQASILTIATILLLVGFCGYMNAKLRELKPRFPLMLIKSIFTASMQPLRDIEHKAFCLFYPISLACYAKIFALLRQFRIGKMYIKVDWGFWSDFILWLCTPLCIMLIISYYENKLKNIKDGSRSNNTTENTNDASGGKG